MSTDQVRERQKPALKIISALLCGFSIFSLNVNSAHAETTSTVNNSVNVTQPVATSWVVLGPQNRTIYKHRSAGLYAVAGGASKPGTLVALQEWHRPYWKAVAVRTINRQGKADFIVKPLTTMNYRVATFGIPNVATSFSRTVLIRVKDDVGLEVVAEAAKHSGAPYVFGAAGPWAFDCSGLVKYVFAHFGKNLPHSATAQGRYGSYVNGRSAKPGDILLFGSYGRFHHVAIYAGNGKMIDAPTYGQKVGYRRIWSRQITIRRLV